MRTSKRKFEFNSIYFNGDILSHSFVTHCAKCQQLVVYYDFLCCVLQNLLTRKKENIFLRVEFVEWKMGDEKCACVCACVCAYTCAFV